MIRSRCGVHEQISFVCRNDDPQVRIVASSAILGNRIAIRMPDVPDPTGDIPYVLVDEVEYANVAPWPTQADGLGAALMRRDLLAYGNDPANWTTAVPLSIQAQPQPVVARVGSNITFTVVANGQGILTYQWQFNGTPISPVTIRLRPAPRCSLPTYSPTLKATTRWRYPTG